MWAFLFLWLTPLIHKDTSAHPLSWEDTHSWKLYALNDSRKVFMISADSIRTLRGNELGDDSMHILLCNSRSLNVQSSPVWMGCYLASYEDKNGKLMKVIVSQYGGFFYTPADNTYYELGYNLRQVWLNYFRRAYIQME